MRPCPKWTRILKAIGWRRSHSRVVDYPLKKQVLDLNYAHETPKYFLLCLSGLFLLHLKQSQGGSSICKVLAASLRTWVWLFSAYKKKLDMVAHSCDSSTGERNEVGEAKIDGSQGLAGQPVSPEWWATGFVIDYVSKKKLESNRGRHLVLTPYIPAHPPTREHALALFISNNRRSHKYSSFIIYIVDELLTINTVC